MFRALQFHRLTWGRGLMWISIFLLINGLWVRSYYYKTNLRAFSSYGFNLFTWSQGGGFSFVVFKSDPSTRLFEFQNTRLDSRTGKAEFILPAVQYTKQLEWHLTFVIPFWLVTLLVVGVFLLTNLRRRSHKESQSG